VNLVSCSVLNHSVHDDPSPVKSKPSNAPNGHYPCPQQYVQTIDSQSNQSGFESSDDQSQQSIRKRKSRQSNHQKMKLHHRSKSTSPKRVGQAAKQRDMFKKFDPDKAEWIKK
jgi:hypothetical protein